MAVTITFTEDTNGRQRVGQQVQVDGYLTLAGTYAAGGFAVAASDFDLARLDSFQVHGSASDGTNALVPWFDLSNLKVMLLTAAGTTGAAVPLDELTATTSVASYVVRCTAKGAGQA